ncbi:hypothetical protein [Devosia sp. DBB001]|nr:hypothetical protein [Devosia sp. DBB001]
MGQTALKRHLFRRNNNTCRRMSADGGAGYCPERRTISEPRQRGLRIEVVAAGRRPRQLITRKPKLRPYVGWSYLRAGPYCPFRRSITGARTDMNKMTIHIEPCGEQHVLVGTDEESCQNFEILDLKRHVAKDLSSGAEHDLDEASGGEHHISTHHVIAQEGKCTKAHLVGPDRIRAGRAFAKQWKLGALLEKFGGLLRVPPVWRQLPGIGRQPFRSRDPSRGRLPIQPPAAAVELRGRDSNGPEIILVPHERVGDRHRNGTLCCAGRVKPAQHPVRGQFKERIGAQIERHQDRIPIANGLAQIAPPIVSVEPAFDPPRDRGNKRCGWRLPLHVADLVTEPALQRCQLTRVPRSVALHGANLSGRIPVGDLPCSLLHLSRRSRKRNGGSAVDRGDIDIGIRSQHRLNVGCPEPNRQHCTINAKFLTYLAARMNHPRCRFEADRSSQIGRSKLAEAMPQHEIRLHIVGLPQSAKADLDAEDRRHGKAGLSHPGRRFVTQQFGLHRPARQGLEAPVKFLKCAGKYWLFQQKPPAHAPPLAALAREGENQFASRRRRAGYDLRQRAANRSRYGALGHIS